MDTHGEFQERVVAVARPRRRFALLTAPDGAMLGLGDDGAPALYDDADDRVVWTLRESAGGIEHAATGKRIKARIEAGACALPVRGRDTTFTIDPGPSLLPSEHLAHLRREGWTCLAGVLPPRTVDSLQRVAGTDRYEHLTMRNDVPKLCQHAAVGRAIAEPVSLWLIRRYMGTRDLHLGHPPGFAVLPPYDGQRPVQGWHADIPYIPSVGGNAVAPRDGPIKAVQRNVCVSDFAKENGATAYKLGSHAAATGPPPEWNPARNGGEPNARPYSGPDADVLEAPAGSIVLYDARTWHRAGINRSRRKRAAMLQSFQAADVIPKRDTRPVCARFQASAAYGQLNARQRRDLVELLMNQPGAAPPELR